MSVARDMKTTALVDIQIDPGDLDARRMLRIASILHGIDTKGLVTVAHIHSLGPALSGIRFSLETGDL